MNDPFQQNEPTLPENTPISLPPREPTLQGTIAKTNDFDRTLWYTIGGIILVSCCGILLLGYFFTKTAIFKQATTFEPFPTLDLTPAPTPNMNATQTAWVKPERSPTLASAEDAKRALEEGNTYGMEVFASYTPDLPDINQPGDVYLYDIQLYDSMPLLWLYGWCTSTNEILDQNFNQMKVEFLLNETRVSEQAFAIDEQTTSSNGGGVCRTFFVLVNEWPSGVHKLETRVTFLTDTNDGWNLYPAGMHTFRYFVSVR